VTGPSVGLGPLVPGSSGEPEDNPELDCLDVGFVPDRLLDYLPTPTALGQTRGGARSELPRIRMVLSAVLVLSPGGAFTVADVTAKVHGLTGGTGFTCATR
jgi:hypothetical protein